MLEIKGLTKSFGGMCAVDDVTFTVAKGEVMGFLGPNGAGKSTTMRMVAGALVPDAGDAVIAGYSVNRARQSALRALGYLPEGAPLYNDMSPPEFLRFIARARGLPRPVRKDRIEAAIADTRVGPVLHKRIGELSKGYRRRVGLAAAILHDPPVLILDEPMDGLDPNQKRAVRALIARMTKTKAILISTHTLEEVPQICSRLIVLDKGRVVADTTPEALAKSAADGGGLERAFIELTDQVEAV